MCSSDLLSQLARHLFRCIARGAEPSRDGVLRIVQDNGTALFPAVSYTHLDVYKRQAHDRIIIVATHVVSDVEHVASEILLLKEGQLVDQVSPAALIEKYAPGGTLEDVYLTIFGEDEA